MPVHVLKQGEIHPSPPGGLQPFTVPQLRARFGFKAVEEGGTWFWEPATEKDYRMAEAERLGVKEEDIEITCNTCYNNGPYRCYGNCAGGVCTLIHIPQRHYYYCVCTYGSQ